MSCHGVMPCKCSGNALRNLYECSIDGGAGLTIHRKYDLKGSTVHRTAKEGEKVLKDNNLRKANGSFKLGFQRDAFLKVGGCTVRGNKGQANASRKYLLL